MCDLNQGNRVTRVPPSSLPLSAPGTGTPRVSTGYKRSVGKVQRNSGRGGGRNRPVSRPEGEGIDTTSRLKLQKLR